MKLIDTTCKNCLAPLVPLGGNKAKCEHCGSVFLVEGKAFDMSASAARKANVPNGNPVDIPKALTRISDDLGFEDSCDWFLGPERANCKKAAKRRNMLYSVTGAPSGEPLWGLLDITLLDSGKKGFLALPSGLYICDEDKKTGHMTWDEFLDVKIRSNSTSLLIDKYKFICQDETIVSDRLQKMQENMRRNGYKK